MDTCPLFGGCPLGGVLSKRLLILYCIGNIDIFYVYIDDQSSGLDNGYKKGNICQKQEYNVSMVAP